MTVRPATVSDAQAICSLINYYAERGRMLHRSLESIYQSLRDFLVAEADGEIVGCVAVEIFWADLAEVRSLAVSQRSRGQGVGTKIVAKAISTARKMGVTKLFALTYEKDFFARLGFEVISRDSLPEKVWRTCIYCPKAEECDETAMILRLSRGRPAKQLPLQRRMKRARPKRPKRVPRRAKKR